MMMMLESAGISPLADFERSADEDNPKGYYELERVKKMKDGDTTWVIEAQGKVVKVISALLPDLPEEYSYKVIFMRRNLTEILASQRKMLLNRGEDPDKISDEEIGKSFERHLAQVTQWLAAQSNFSTLFIDYNRLLEDPAPQVEEIRRFLGVELEAAKMIAAIDPKLYRQKAGGARITG